MKPRVSRSIGKRCHESRIVDEGHNWRVVYRVDSDAIVIGDVFEKKTRKSPRDLVESCKRPKLGSSQSRIAKMESGDPSVSLDLPIRSLFKLGATRLDIARHLAFPKKRRAA